MTIVITGANRGIGAGLAAFYQEAGEEVVGAARSGGDVTLDVMNTTDQAQLAAHLGDQAVDLLICNAGVFLDRGETLEHGYAPELWADTFGANVTGVFLTVQTLLPHLRRAKAGKIAIISSQMGAHSKASGSALIYRASKAAALNLGSNLAMALKPDGIAVGVYHPGWVQTDMGGGAADITIDASVHGLAARFAALDMLTTGCFENWDGRPHAY